MTTNEQYQQQIAKCQGIFMRKTQDYGTSWRIMRPSSLTDQMYIKANRIRTIEINGFSAIQESVEGEYRALVNYGLMAIIQCNFSQQPQLKITDEAAIINLYEHQCIAAYELMQKKNHDYGEIWRDMRITSLTDLILTKLLRIKQIEDNDGKTLESEGVVSNYLDIVNYAIFSLIKLSKNE